MDKNRTEGVASAVVDSFSQQEDEEFSKGLIAIALGSGASAATDDGMLLNGTLSLIKSSKNFLSLSLGDLKLSSGILSL